MADSDWREHLTLLARSGDRVCVVWRSGELGEKTLPMAAVDALGMCEKLVELGAEIVAIHRDESNFGLRENGDQA